MRNFPLIFLSLLTAIISSSSGLAVEETSMTNIDDIHFYMSSLNTIDALLTQLTQFGILSRDENRAIRLKIESKNISAEMALKPGVRQLDTVRFGQVHFQLLPNNKIRSDSGRIFALAKPSSADHFFVEILDEFDHPNSANLSFLPKAYADANLADQINAALEFTVLKIVQLPMTVVSGAGALALGVPAMAIAGGLNYHLKNRVRCHGADYEIDRGYSDFYGKRLLSLSMSYSSKSKMQFAEPHVAAAFGTGGEFLKKVITNDRDYGYVVPDLFAEAFHPHRVPKCNSKSAAKAQDYMQLHAKSDLTEISEQIRNMHLGSDPSNAAK